MSTKIEKSEIAVGIFTALWCLAMIFILVPAIYMLIKDTIFLDVWRNILSSWKEILLSLF